MTLTASRALPGIRFEAQPPITEDVLPRMDVAGFVGFAASGPVGVPVAVEDPAQFAAIFGADAPLAWDTVAGEQAYAYLAPAVRAFFRNGGRRCFVVRVAGAGAAVDVFELAGLAGVFVDRVHRPPHRFEPAMLRAASPGSWADPLTVATRIEATPLRYERADLAAGTLTALVARPDEVVRGDLLRLRFGVWTLLVVVADAPRPAGAGRVELRFKDAFWLRPAILAAGATGAISWLAGDGTEVAATATVIDARDGDVRIALDEHATAAPRAGATLCATLGGSRLALSVTGVQSADDRVALAGSATAIHAARPAAMPARPGAGVAERLELELHIGDGGGAARVLRGLGFAADHPRFVGALLDDAQRFAAPAAWRPASGDPAAAAGPLRLAGPERAPDCYLPLVETQRALGALRPPGDARPRDGLERFDMRLFVDPDLATTGVRHMLDTAAWLRDVSPRPRAPQGIHALLDHDEVTIVAVPDAVHREWSAGPAAAARAPLAAPARTDPEPADFRDCALRTPPAPELALAGEAGGGAFTLRWTASDAGAGFELQESDEPDLGSPRTLYDGAARTFEVRDRPPGFILYYQVRAVAGGVASDWSNRLLVRTPPDRRWLLASAADYDPAPLVALQVAQLRMCAARGDMLAVLALPEHYRTQAAVAHVSALEAASGAVDAARAGARDPILGYGAVYHPWLHACESEGPASLRLLPPDGAAGGVMAARAWRRGAWVAPANEPLRDVVALAPAIAAADGAALQDAQINLVRREPEGFLWMAADTLAGDADVRPIGVRRLLQTLRRLAQSRGDGMVFEDDDDVTRRAVRRTFEALLGRMFELGAFAGRIPDEGFRVDTPPATGDGRIVVELRVAPAQPLEFIVVRLVSAGAGVLVEGR